MTACIHSQLLDFKMCGHSTISSYLFLRVSGRVFKILRRFDYDLRGERGPLKLPPGLQVDVISVTNIANIGSLKSDSEILCGA